MLIEGPALFYDGRSSGAGAVRFSLDVGVLSIFGSDGGRLESWSLDRLRRADSGPGQLRLGVDGSDARLEIVDPGLVQQVGAALRDVPGNEQGSWSGMGKVAVWLVAAVASLGAVVLYGVPALADRLAPLIPLSVEQQIGLSVKPQILSALGRGGTAKLCSAAPGAAALKKLVDPYIAASGPPQPIKIEVIDVGVPNAFALPGGQILILRGLIDRVNSAEELAGVVAHEIGHVAHRDSMRGLVKSASLSIVAGLVIGDFTGSTIAIAVGRNLVDAGYSREAEGMADDYAVGLIRGLGRDPGALGSALERISSAAPKMDGLLSWFSTHPATAERAETLRRAGSGLQPAAPALTAAEWASLKAICR